MRIHFTVAECKTRQSHPASAHQTRLISVAESLDTRQKGPGNRLHFEATALLLQPHAATRWKPARDADAGHASRGPNFVIRGGWTSGAGVDCERSSTIPRSGAG